MRAYLPNYELYAPKTLKEALAKLEDSKFTPLAGGTDIMVLFEAGKLSAGKFLSIWNLEELKGIEVSANQISIGALTTYSEIREHPLIREEFPNLVSAARETGSLAIQNRGTIGGNIVNASPAADTCPALLAYDAQIEISSSNQVRQLDYQKFHLGYKKIDLRPSELLTKIILSRATNDGIHFYRKVGTRKAQAISKTCLAAFAKMDKKRVQLIHLAFASVAPIPFRCLKTEKFLMGQSLNAKSIEGALEVLGSEIHPIDDIRSNRDYRSKVSQNILKDFLESL